VGVKRLATAVRRVANLFRHERDGLQARQRLTTGADLLGFVALSLTSQRGTEGVCDNPFASLSLTPEWGRRGFATMRQMVGSVPAVANLCRKPRWIAT
jgi:hypothetical protein